MPKFSVVIPTRARPDTLAHALRTAVEQSYRDIEILVHESGDDPRIAETVARVGDGRTRHVKTGENVSMTENWERALACASGEYITFIGDDDGLLSDACATVSRVLSRDRVEIVSWRPPAYYWPQYVLDHQRNRLQGFIGDVNALEVKSSSTLLELFYRFREDYSRLPMIYNSFISRTLVDRVREKVGHYFIGAAPDVSSGIVNAFFSSNFLFSGRPLSVAGLSHHSTGHRVYFSRDAAQREAAEAAAFDSVRTHPTLVPSANLKIFLANEMLLVKERAFPTEGPTFDYRRFVYAILQSLESGPGDYDSSLADAREIARRNAIAIEEFGIPSRPQPIAVEPQGVRPSGDAAMLMDIDCAGVDIANIHGAVRLMAALAPPVDQRTPIHAGEPMRAIPVVSPIPVAIDFSANGNGVLFLGFGWGDLEPWGIWTVGRRAELTLRMEGCLQGPMLVRLEGQMFLHATLPRASGRVLLNGRSLAGFEAAYTRPNVDLEFTVTPEDLSERDALNLELEIDTPTSPAESGISSDTRRLGLGLRRIVVTP